MAVTLINVFRVPRDQAGAFLAGWKKTSEAMVSRKGFIDARLHRNTGLANIEFLYANVAHWRTSEDLKASDPKAVWDANSLPGVQDFPGLFEKIITLP